MIKRVSSALLWFLAGWSLWGLIAVAGGFTPLLGPVLGAIMAMFVAGDPLHKLWARRTTTLRDGRWVETVQPLA